MRSLRLVALLAISAQVADCAAAALGRSVRCRSMRRSASPSQNNPTLPDHPEQRSRPPTPRFVRRTAALLPSVSVELPHELSAGRHPVRPGRCPRRQRDTYQSSYRLGAELQHQRGRRLRAAGRRGEPRRGRGGRHELAEALRARVTQQYIAALKARRRPRVLDTLVATAGPARSRQREDGGRRRNDHRRPHGGSRARPGAGERAHGAQQGASSTSSACSRRWAFPADTSTRS